MRRIPAIALAYAISSYTFMALWMWRSGEFQPYLISNLGIGRTILLFLFAPLKLIEITIDRVADPPSSQLRWWSLGYPFFFTLTMAGCYAALRRCRREPLEGHCRYCGYDLRATPKRCPECGRESSSN